MECEALLELTSVTHAYNTTGGYSTREICDVLIESISNKITSFGLCLLQRVSAKAFFRYDTRLVQHPSFVELWTNGILWRISIQVQMMAFIVPDPLNHTITGSVQYISMLNCDVIDPVQLVKLF